MIINCVVLRQSAAPVLYKHTKECARREILDWKQLNCYFVPVMEAPPTPKRSAKSYFHSLQVLWPEKLFPTATTVIMLDAGAVSLLTAIAEKFSSAADFFNLAPNGAVFM